MSIVCFFPLAAAGIGLMMTVGTWILFWPSDLEVPLGRRAGIGLLLSALALGWLSTLLLLPY